ncbi:MAG: sugar transferase [Planctomycetes bacterium]|nr:sugar transferase [Planctomycetota bacterium]
MVKGVVIGFLLSFAVLFFYREFSYSRVAFVLFGGLAVIVGFTCRIFFRWLRLHILQKSGSLNRLVIVGYNKIGLSLAEAVAERPIGYELVGFVNDTFTAEAQSAQSVLGRVDELPTIITTKDIDEVWIALPDAPRDKLKQLVEVCLQAKVSFRIVPDLYEVMLEWMRIDSINGIPLIGVKRSNITGLNVLIKRLLDIVFSSLLIIISGLPMLIIGILIKLTSAGPVFFIQKRVSRNGRRFAFLKFRTMYHNIDRTSHKEYTEKWIEGKTAVSPALMRGKTGIKDESGQMTEESNEPVVHKMTDDPRITPVGRFLRRFSLDELPHLRRWLNWISITLRTGR